jgi:hypothetical protein
MNWTNDYWFPETRTNPFYRKIKIAKLFHMDIDKIGYTHWHFIGHPYKVVYKIPIGDIDRSRSTNIIKSFISNIYKKIKKII